LDAAPLAYQTTAALVIHLFNAVIVLVGGVGSVYLRFRHVEGVHEGVFGVGLGLVGGGIAALTAAVGYAAAVNFDNGLVHVLTETAIAVVCCTAGATIGAYWWRRGAPTHGRRYGAWMRMIAPWIAGFIVLVVLWPALCVSSDPDPRVEPT